MAASQALFFLLTVNLQRTWIFRICVALRGQLVPQRVFCATCHAGLHPCAVSSRADVSCVAEVGGAAFRQSPSAACSSCWKTCWQVEAASDELAEQLTARAILEAEEPCGLSLSLGSCAAFASSGRAARQGSQERLLVDRALHLFFLENQGLDDPTVHEKALSCAVRPFLQ